MVDFLGLQRRVLIVLILFFSAGIAAAGLAFLRFDKTSDGDAVREISAGEIGSFLRYEGEVHLPSWGIEGVSLYDDHFTAPHVTVRFENGVSLKVSTSKFASRDSAEFTLKQGGLYYQYLPPERLTDSEVVRLKNEIAKWLTTPRTADSGLRGVAA